MRKDYFEMNLKKLIQKCRPAAYRPEFKEDLFCQMTREMCQGARESLPAMLRIALQAGRPAAARPEAVALPRMLRALARRVSFQSVQLRLILEAAAVPMILLVAGIFYLTNSRTNLPVEDGKVIVFQSADNRDYIMGNGQNAVNYIAHASSSHGSCQNQTPVRAGDLRQDSLQSSATNNS